METKASRTGAVRAALGFAADERGSGVAYAQLERGPLLRVPFALKRFPALLGREVGYAALSAVPSALRERGIERVAFSIADAALVDDVHQRRDVPPALTLAYVRLGCALNAFREYSVSATPESESDLTARARAEVALHVAA